MSDLIDRQAALDVFKNLIDIGGIFTEEPLIGGALIAVREAIARLPSVQPEQECEKCIFRPFKQFQSEPSAQSEPKKGKWIEDPDENFASTYHCSNCGVSPVVDNYEQYVFSDFCPFCGADMRGER